ncbi:MAG TPA: hypothetical protein VFW71_15275 [Actinomycetota bacterium]|nr:hypothetical protein [Actinomycetota bacterium]
MGNTDETLTGTNNTPLDGRGFAVGALREGVAQHGAGVLSDPGLLGHLLGDRIAGLPTERSLLLRAAGGGVATMLQGPWRREGPDAAIELTDRTFALQQQLGLPQATWAAQAFQQALAYAWELAPPPPDAGAESDGAWLATETGGRRRKRGR